MRRSVAVAILAICSCVFVHAQEAGPSASTPSIAGTRWTGNVKAPQADGTLADRFYRCEFQAGNRLRCEYAATVLTNGSWFQNERLFRMDLNDGYSSWLGSIDGDRMSGNAVNKLGHKWSWTFTRVPGVASTSIVPSSDWINHSDAPGRFSISMPVKPVKSEQLVDTESGKLTNNVLLAETGNSAFLVSYVDHAVPQDPQKALERVRDGAVKGINGTLAGSTSISHKGFPGLEFQASAQGNIYTSRIYLVNSRLYQIVVVAPPGSAMSKEINRYMTSFDLKTTQ
ncbi:MAG TPA: hypothetical protein VNO50_15600 [Pyrinomonadaceae bacterium]|nr:hypothetical protein [Pyrinomonadaceae bacterium]